MRIGINVPNELLKQVKQIRPEVNVSQVCREALRHRVELELRATELAISDRVDELVAQLDLSVEKPMIEPDWEAYGFADARDWVRTVTPKEWDMFIELSDFSREDGRSPSELVDLCSNCGEHKGLSRCLRDNEEWFINQYDNHYVSGISVDLYKKAQTEYARAWLAYVNQARRKLDKRRKEEYDKVMAEREALKRLRPEPEAPAQLL